MASERAPEAQATPGVPEAAVGLGTFLTRDLPGIGGHVKRHPEDFVVEEVPLNFPRPQQDGKYTVAAVRARNWETNRLMREIADRLGVSKRAIFFAGTKDKRAVTTQYVSVRAPLELVKNLDIRDVEILEAFRVDRAPKIGELVGNRFVVKARLFDDPLDVAFTRAQDVLARLEAAGGFPNYFGLQRFGVVRPVTHEVGRLILQDDWRGAVHAYVGGPVSGELPDVTQARARFDAEGDVKAALGYFPPYLTFERQMLHHLAEAPDDFVGAIRKVPPNLSSMFVYAWQSLLFNRIITARLERGLGLNAPEIGDVVLALGPDGTTDKKRFIPVSSANIGKVRKQCERGKAFVSAVIFGTNVAVADGVQGEIERAVLQEEGVTRDEFKVPAFPEIGSGGTRREMLAPLGPVAASSGTDEHGDFLEFKFFLNKGSYATCLLREVLKSKSVAYMGGAPSPTPA